MEEKITEQNIKQETCECGNRSFFILCWHETSVQDNITSDKHNWIVVCSNCGRFLENDDLFFNMHEQNHVG